MYLERKYHFDASKFSKDSALLFSEYIQECERDFHAEHLPLYANHLKGNRFVMQLLHQSFMDGDDAYQFGLDDGLTMKESTEMDVFSEYSTVYAIATFHDEDEPLFLMIQDSLQDHEFLLCHLPDDDDDDDQRQRHPRRPQDSVDERKTEKEAALLYAPNRMWVRNGG